MNSRYKVNRNDQCPCNSGKKFKNCCLGKVDWETIAREGRDPRPYLSVRGRNLYFTARILDALELSIPGKIRSLKDYKARFTTDAVQRIHEAVMETWPPSVDICEMLHRPSGEVSGLYIGDYGAEYLARGVVRHSIYANKILLIDPFIYPTSVRDEFNPILNPAQYRAQTLKNVNLWFGLVPWIEAGIVEIIRPPADFDHRLNWKFMTDQMRKFEENAELKKASDESVKQLSKRHTSRLLYQQLLLGAPDEYLRQRFEELELGKDGLTVEEFLKSVQEERARPRLLGTDGSERRFTTVYDNLGRLLSQRENDGKYHGVLFVHRHLCEVERDRTGQGIPQRREQGLVTLRKGLARRPVTLPEQPTARSRPEPPQRRPPGVTPWIPGEGVERGEHRQSIRQPERFASSRGTGPTHTGGRAGMEADRP